MSPKALTAIVTVSPRTYTRAGSMIIASKLRSGAAAHGPGTPGFAAGGQCGGRPRPAKSVGQSLQIQHDMAALKTQPTEPSIRAMNSMVFHDYFSLPHLSQTDLSLPQVRQTVLRPLVVFSISGE